MKIVDLVQGSPEWHAHRRKYWNASDAPAMMDMMLQALTPIMSNPHLIHTF